jgi:PKD repeat protein
VQATTTSLLHHGAKSPRHQTGGTTPLARWSQLDSGRSRRGVRRRWANAAQGVVAVASIVGAFLLGGCGWLPANISASPDNGWAPLSVQFSLHNTVRVIEWLWDFGDGSANTSPSPVHIYTAPGSYTVTLTATYVTASGLEAVYVTTQSNCVVVRDPAPAEPQDRIGLLGVTPAAGAALACGAVVPFRVSVEYETSVPSDELRACAELGLPNGRCIGLGCIPVVGSAGTATIECLVNVSVLQQVLSVDPTYTGVAYLGISIGVGNAALDWRSLPDCSYTVTGP